MGSRIYKGLWRVRVTYDTGSGLETAFTEPADYELCETFVLLVGEGLLYEGHVVKSTLIERQPVN